MRKPGILGNLSVFSLCAAAAWAAGPPQTVLLVVPAGAPLRLYLTRRVSKRAGAEVEAKVADPVYAFDREVIPAGAVILGRVSSVYSVPRAQRIRAVLNGDFTPLHSAAVEFTTLVLPDGRRIPLHTVANVGLNSFYSGRAARTAPQNPAAPRNTGVLGTGKQKVEDAVHAQVARAKSIPDLVRSPDKKEKVEDYLVSRLPYHPQWVRKGTRFDAELSQALDFGTEPATPGLLAAPGAQPPAGIVGRARLVTALDSASSKPGEEVEAVLSEPVFSADHKLILPEGTVLKGSVVEAKRARHFHRGGSLRFRFQDLELPAEVARLEAAGESAPAAAASASAPRPAQQSLKFRTQADLAAAESGGKTPLKVDSEGGVQAKESKARFLAAAASVMIARRSGDLDPVRNQSGQVVGQSQNVGGRTVGGGFGFGLLGAGIAQSSRYVGAAFGYYGLAWSLYSTLIARGADVQFDKHAMIDVRFEARPAAGAHP
jgi:hypothetical protein